jgi:hypothetical protein
MAAHPRVGYNSSQGPRREEHSLEQENMSKVILDPDLKARLNGLKDKLEICDADGRTLGHFLPEGVYRQLVYAALEAACPHSKEEQERRRQETGGRSLAEFWKSLGPQ